MKNRLEVYVGGAFAQATEAIQSHSIRGVIDAFSEIKRLFRNLASSDADNGYLRAFSLGADQTLFSLLSHFSDRSHPWLSEAANLPNSQFEHGLAQLKLAGYFAAELAKKQGLKEYLEELFSLFLRSTNAQIGEIDVRIFAGTSGGTGPDVARTVATHLGNHISASSGRMTTVNLIRLGALSFEGLGYRIKYNTSACLFEDLAWLLAPPEHNEIVRRLLLCELPLASNSNAVIGGQKQIRDGLAVQLAEALSSREVDEYFQLINPNLDLNPSGLGTVRLVRAEWWKALRNADILFTMANKYAAALAEIEFEPNRSTSDQSTFPAISYKASPNKEYVEPAHALVERLSSKNALPSRQDFEREIRQGRSFDVQVRLQYQSQFKPENILSVLEDPISTASYSAALQQLKGTVWALEDKIESLRHEKAHAEALMVQADTMLTGALALWYPRTIMDRIRSSILSTDTRLRRLEQAIEEYRSSAEKAAEMKAVLTAMEATLLSERRIYDSYRDRPGQLKERLGEIIEATGGDSGRVNSDYYRFADLDDIFSGILSNRDDLESLNRILRDKCLIGVTIAGLAAIADLEGDPTASGILQAFISGRAEYSAPQWGAQTLPRKPLKTIIVLPPVSPSAFHELVSALNESRHLREHYLLARSERCAFGANVVVLQVYNAGHPWEVIPRQYFHGIQTMDREQYFIDWEGLQNSTRLKKIYDELCRYHGLGVNHSEEVDKDAA
jgi:hypothetical protein